MSGMFGIDAAPAMVAVPVVRWPMNSNPFRVVACLWAGSQGSPRRATLGWLIQSRWNCASAIRANVGRRRGLSSGGAVPGLVNGAVHADSRPPFMIALVPRYITDLCHGASWDCAVVAPNGEARSARRERQRRSIIQPKVVSFRRNYPGSIPPNQTANPERVECVFASDFNPQFSESRLQLHS